MKLFTKYNRVNITATIITFVIGSVAFYFLLQYILIRQLDQTLRVERQEITDYVKKHDTLPDIQSTTHQWIEIVNTTEVLAKPIKQTIPYYNAAEKENESVRQLIFSLPVRKQLFRITVNQSQTETEDQLQLILLIITGMIACILLSNYLINRRLVTRLWKPFYTTIESIKEYQLSAREPLHLPKEPIDEIELLNNSLNKMTGRIHEDYSALKTFTENASHEMQTPLAVIRLQVESLLQHAEKEKAIQQLLSIEDATLKLSKLHQSLLLLTKLENRQFLLNEPVNLAEIMRDKLAERSELITARELILSIGMEETTFNFHKHLAEILVNNLLNNVIRYTPVHGTVSIRLTADHLSIKNYAADGELDNTRIFQRFYKHEQSAESTGLGLSIVKEICTLAGFTIGYRYIFHEHEFIIDFNRDIS